MTKLDPEIVRLWKMGFAIHWLRRKSKIPVEKNWTTGPRLSLKELAERFRPGQNPGVRLGRVSEVGGAYLAVIDLDVKSEDPAHLEEAMAWVGQHYPEAALGPSVLSGRGNGSAHFYVRVETPVSKNDVKARSKEIVRVKMPSVSPNADERQELTLGEIAMGIRFRPAWEVSLLCEGRQAALVGAIHPDTENRYAWGKRPQSPDDFPVIDVAGEVAGQPAAADNGAGGKIDFVDVDLEKTGLRPNQIAAIIDGTGVKDRSAEVFSLCMALLQRRVPDNQILSIFTDRQYYLGEVAFDHAKTTDRWRAAQWVQRYNLSKAKTKVDSVVFDLQERLPEGHVRKEEEEWTKQLEMGGNPPRIKPTFLNLQLILAKRCGSLDFIARDLFSLNDSFTVDTPWGNTKGQRRAAGNDDALRVKKWLGAEYGIEANTHLIEEIFSITAIENGHHPLREYLNGLNWDGVPRVANAFKTYMGAEMPEPYLTDVTRKFFLACVKRAFHPGCKFDHVPILEGLTGKGKSSFVRYLVGDEWFMDGLPNMADKDASLYLQGIWVCELGELATLNRSGGDVVKIFIARTTDKFRPPYGQRRADFPRTTLFVGTTDQDDYLSDPAGNRRFWPVRVAQCDFKALLRDRDQLWAEAVFLHHFEEENLWLEGDAASQVLAIHATRKIDDENDSLLESWDHWCKTGEPPNEVRLVELFKPGMPFFSHHFSQANSRAAARVLRVRGFKRKHTHSGNIWVHWKTLVKSNV